MKLLNVAVLAPLLLCASCSGLGPAAKADAWRKVELDLAQLDADGLRGPPDGKVAVSYEVRIPNTAACRDQVKAIDPTVEFMPGARGRIGASPQECLCIGSTNQARYREVLQNLAGLPWVDRIIECYFE
jgi:hypothetical protein